MVDVTLLADYAWADIAKAAKISMMSAALGGGDLTINGRRVTRITIDEASALYSMALQQIALESNTGGNNVLVRFGDA